MHPKSLSLVVQTVGMGDVVSLTTAAHILWYTLQLLCAVNLISLFFAPVPCQYLIQVCTWKGSLPCSENEFGSHI